MESGGCSLDAVRGPLLPVASLVSERGLQGAQDFSSGGSRALEHRLQWHQQDNARHDDQCGGDGGGGHGDGADDLLLGGAGLGFCDGRGIHGTGDAHVGHIARQEAQIHTLEGVGPEKGFK